MRADRRVAVMATRTRCRVAGFRALPNRDPSEAVRGLPSGRLGGWPGACRGRGGRARGTDRGPPASAARRRGHACSRRPPSAAGSCAGVEVGGVVVDVGAEAMLNRRPEGVELARELGLEIEHPATTSSRIWTRGALRPLPRSLMGVPLDLDELRRSGVLSEAGLARVADEQPGCPVGEDVSVGDLVASRLGDEVVDRLVEPLLGGVYAGHARHLSARATVPQLVRPGRAGTAARRGAALLRASRSSPGCPAGWPGSPRRWLRASTYAPARRSASWRGPRTASPWWSGRRRLRNGSRRTRSCWPPRPRRPRGCSPNVAPAGAAELAGIESASMAVVTFAFRAGDVSGLDDSSGFLVPPVDGRSIKASTFSFAKWAWVRRAGDAAGMVHLRTSLGRHREEAVLQRADDELVALSLADLADAVGLTARPVDTHVQRWGGGLPQYAVGHLDRVARIRAAVAACPGSRSAGRRTTGSACRPSSRPRTGRWPSCGARCSTRSGAAPRSTRRRAAPGRRPHGHRHRVPRPRRPGRPG